jgi:hypothetical protein
VGIGVCTAQLARDVLPRAAYYTPAQLSLLHTFALVTFIIMLLATICMLGSVSGYQIEFYFASTLIAFACMSNVSWLPDRSNAWAVVQLVCETFAFMLLITGVLRAISRYHARKAVEAYWEANPV